jgi:hypothetical protein
MIWVSFRFRHVFRSTANGIIFFRVAVVLRKVLEYQSDCLLTSKHRGDLDESKKSKIARKCKQGHIREHRDWCKIFVLLLDICRSYLCDRIDSIVQIGKENLISSLIFNASC